MTQLPRVEFDAATDTEVIMEIPYVSPYLAFDCTNASGHVGSVSLMVYVPLDTPTGELTAEYTIWCHFEDIELQFPTISNPAVVPQAGGRRTMRVGKRDPLETEAEGKPISGALIRVSNAAKQLSFVPGLNSFMGAASWAASAASNAAAAFGFSNPRSMVSAHPFQQRVFANAINSNGQDNSIQMACDAENKIEMLPGFASSGLDEMAFAFPLSISTYDSTINWADSSVPLAVLYNMPLMPNSFFYSSGHTDIADTIPVSYISSFFQLYRGSIRFKFKFVKTEFHSGRLAFVYIPGWVGSTPPALTDANMSYCHRDIVDIAGLNEYEMVCPYVSTVPYLENQTPYGTLRICVLNQLRHPDTVAAFISIIVEISCCSDFEFAIPLTPVYPPLIYTTNATPQAGIGLDGQPLDQDTETEKPEPAIGTSSITADSLASARFTVGESIRSWRQLCKRATPFENQNGGSGTLYVLYPWLNDIATYNLTTSTYTQAQSLPDYYIAMVNCYAFFRGSVRLRFYNPAAASTTQRAIISTNPADCLVGFTATPSTNIVSCLYAPVVPFPANVYPNGELSIPYYNQLSQSVSSTCNFGYNPTINPSTPRVVVSFWMTGNSIITRQIGEDFSAGFWTGSLPLQVGGTLLTAQSW
jgi:hypothetical protein